MHKGAAIAQWIHLCLPSCRPGFESQAHHQRLFHLKYLCYLCHVKRTKIKTKKWPGLAHFFTKKQVLGRSSECTGWGRVLYKPHSHPNGFYWSHQCSCSLTPANRIQTSITQSCNHNRIEPGPRQGLNFAQEVWVDWGAIRCQQILVRQFTCTLHGDLVWLISTPITALVG